MKLWTFQSTKSVNELVTFGTLVAKWERYKNIPNWELSYRWMSSQMNKRGINCKDNAPIWAWHSCQEYKKAPTLDDARALLSDSEIEAGIEVIEFECPNSIALLSFYSIWNDILDQFIQGDTFIDLNEALIERLFDVSPANFKKEDSIQAALPFLKKKWIIEIRTLNLKPNDFNYDSKEFV